MPNIAQWVQEGDDVGKDAGDNASQEEKTIFGTEISSLKSLHRKYRFVHFFGSAKGGGVQEGSNLLGKPTVKYLGRSSHIFTNFEAHFTFFFKICMFCETFPRKPGLPARIHTQSSKHGRCPICSRRG